VSGISPRASSSLLTGRPLSRCLYSMFLPKRYPKIYNRELAHQGYRIPRDVTAPPTKPCEMDPMPGGRGSETGGREG